MDIFKIFQIAGTPQLFTDKFHFEQFRKHLTARLPAEIKDK